MFQKGESLKSREVSLGSEVSGKVAKRGVNTEVGQTATALRNRNCR